jgi:hypothetical protein
MSDRDQSKCIETLEQYNLHFIAEIDVMLMVAHAITLCDY